jgi:hypothetical protein
MNGERPTFSISGLTLSKALLRFPLTAQLIGLTKNNRTLLTFLLFNFSQNKLNKQV